MKKLILPFLLITLISCGKSEEELKKEAEEVVKTFVSEVMLENFNSASEHYPDFAGFNYYQKPKNFEISSTTINEESRVKVTGVCKYSEAFEENMQFTLEQNDEGIYKIVKSKGLSSYIGTPLYKALKRSGCLTDSESDYEINKDYEKKEADFAQLVAEYTATIEENVTMVKTGSNLEKSYGNFYISGDIMVKNETNIDIPGFSYDLYVLIYDGSGEVVHTHRCMLTSSQIPANGVMQMMVPMIDCERAMRSYSIRLVVKDNIFIQNYIGNNVVMDC